MDSSDIAFAPGQVWCYETRPQEPASRVVISRIDGNDELGQIVHVRITGVDICDANGETAATVIAHAPLAGDVLRTCVTHLSDEPPGQAEDDDGYEVWRESFEAGEAGVFTIPVSEIVEMMEHAIAQADDLDDEDHDGDDAFDFDFDDDDDTGAGSTGRA